MIRRLLCAVALVCVAWPVGAASDLAEDWIKVQQAIVTENREEFDERIRQLQERAGELQARRLTPFAEGLTLWAEPHPSDLGWLAVRTARELDPELPSTYFLVAGWQWRNGGYLGAVQSYLAGWWALFLFEPTRWMLATSVVGWVVFALAWSLLLAVILQVLVFLPRMVHDALELSRLIFRPANAVVLAVAILILPLFGGLGPAWLLSYLFALSWSYMSARQRAAAVATCILLALAMPAVVVWQGSMLRWPSLQARIANLLAERRIDYPTLREFAKVEPEMGDIVEYRALLGELYRMHGEPDAARIEFQKANLVDDGKAIPLIFLGNLSLEDGDVQLAIQQYNQAIELDPGNALAYRNLSFAYDQSRRFQDGDAARNTAKRIAGEGWEHLGIRGRDRRIRYPRLGTAEIAGMLAMAPHDVHLHTGPSTYLDRFVAELLSPESMVFWVSGLLGLIVVLVRGKWMWIAQMCTKCGKVFCSRCKTATESDTYCSQCISVFLKPDVVAIDQQKAKQAGIRRWEMWSTAARRAAGVLMPGSHYVLDGRPWLGLATGFLAWLSLSGAVLWATMVLPEVERTANIVPIQVILVLAFVAVWLTSAVGAWQRR